MLRMTLDGYRCAVGARTPNADLAAPSPRRVVRRRCKARV